jgi:hypothetical protein
VRIDSSILPALMSASSGFVGVSGSTPTPSQFVFGDVMVDEQRHDARDRCTRAASGAS